MGEKDTSRLIEFLLNNEEETAEDAREYLKQTGADPEEMIRRVVEVLEGSVKLRVKSLKLGVRNKRTPTNGTN